MAGVGSSQRDTLTGIGNPKPSAHVPGRVFALIGVAAFVGMTIEKLIRGRKRSTAWRQAKKV
jgi:hypothetical protein